MPGMVLNTSHTFPGLPLQENYDVSRIIATLQMSKLRFRYVNSSRICSSYVMKLTFNLKRVDLDSQLYNLEF